MKTIQILIFSVLFVGFSFVSKADGENKGLENATYTMMFYNEISNQLSYPQIAKDMGVEGFVVVSFTIDSGGNLLVLEMNSNDPIFMESAKQSLSAIKLCSHAAGKIYNMQFNYSLY